MCFLSASRFLSRSSRTSLYTLAASLATRAAWFQSDVQAFPYLPHSVLASYWGLPLLKCESTARSVSHPHTMLASSLLKPLSPSFVALDRSTCWWSRPLGSLSHQMCLARGQCVRGARLFLLAVDACRGWRRHWALLRRASVWWSLCASAWSHVDGSFEAF